MDYDNFLLGDNGQESYMTNGQKRKPSYFNFLLGEKRENAAADAFHPKQGQGRTYDEFVLGKRHLPHQNEKSKRKLH